MDNLCTQPASNAHVKAVSEALISSSDVNTGTDQGLHDAINGLQQVGLQGHATEAQCEGRQAIDGLPDVLEFTSSAQERVDGSQGASPGMYEDATAVPAGETAARAAVRTSGTSTDPQRQKGSTSGRLVPQQVGQQWICAAKDGYMPLLQSLYQQHPELLNHQPAAGLRCSALHWAAARGHADALQQLLLWGADPCLLTSTGSSCLHSAAAADRQECVKLLLRTPQVLQHLDHTNEDGLTAAALAGKHGHKVVQGLLQTAAASGGRPAAVAGAVSSTHQQVPDVPAAATAASGVAKQQRAGTGLRSGFFNKPQSTRAPPKHQPSGAPANAAAAAGHVAVSNAHKHSKPPSATEATCSSSHSSQSDSQAAVTSSIGRSWLDAARRGDLAAMEQLLSQHPQLMQYNGTGTSYAFTGNSALHWSAAKGYTHVVLWLLQHGADVQQVNEAGESALHTAVGHRQVACAQALVMQGGADMHMQDGLGQSPAEVAGAAGGQSLVTQLLQWDLARTLTTLDRSSWTAQQMQQLIRLAGRSVEAVACAERHELQQLTQDVLRGLTHDLNGAADATGSSRGTVVRAL